MSLFGSDDTKQAKSLIFIVVTRVKQFPKVQKKKDVRVLDFIRTYNNSSYKLTQFAFCARQSWLILSLIGSQFNFSN